MTKKTTQKNKATKFPPKEASAPKSVEPAKGEATKKTNPQVRPRQSGPVLIPEKKMPGKVQMPWLWFGLAFLALVMGIWKLNVRDPLSQEKKIQALNLEEGDIKILREELKKANSYKPPVLDQLQPKQ